MREAHFKDWYGGNCENVNRLIRYFNHILEQHAEPRKLEQVLKLSPVALISPHAGWAYGGFTANFGYRILANGKKNKKRVVVIGPSHRYPIEGVSITLEEEYETPCGPLFTDRLFNLELMEKFDIKNLEYLHTEHSTEVQMPFIKHYLNLPIVELIYGEVSPKELASIIRYSLEKDSLVVISSDLSHYYPLKIANKLDYFCLEGVADLNLELLQKCEACGKKGIEGMVITAKKIHLTPIVVDYRTSADVNGDKNQVVGYMSAIFLR